MSYPAHLLPAINYKKIDFDATERRNRYLVVYTDDKNIIDPRTERPRVDILPEATERFRDFSTNILGLFEPIDVKWHWQGERAGYYTHEEWEEGRSVPPPMLGTDVYEDHARGFYFWRLTDLHNFSGKANEGEKDEFPFVGKVVHTPMNGNFWHCSLRWYTEGKDSKQMTKGQLRRIMSIAKSYLLEKIITEIPAYQALDPDKYTNESTDAI